VKQVAIINYGAGNLASVVNALEFLDYKAIILNKPEKNINFSHIILPGVGAFGQLAKNLNHLGFNDYLSENKEKGNFILGICVGMQLLFKNSDEGNDQEGLKLIDGKFKLFEFIDQKKLPLPHIGFSKVKHNNGNMWKDIPNNSYFYFIHSYKISKIPKGVKFGTSNYGEQFISFVEHDNIIGSQFHPEKSHKHGIKFLSNFLNL